MDEKVLQYANVLCVGGCPSHFLEKILKIFEKNKTKSIFARSYHQRQQKADRKINLRRE